MHSYFQYFTIGDRLMLINDARKIVGNQPNWAIKNMHKALSLHSWLNTPIENKRFVLDIFNSYREVHSTAAPIMLEPTFEGRSTNVKCSHFNRN